MVPLNRGPDFWRFPPIPRWLGTAGDGVAGEFGELCEFQSGRSKWGDTHTQPSETGPAGESVYVAPASGQPEINSPNSPDSHVTVDDEAIELRTWRLESFPSFASVVCGLSHARPGACD